MYIHLVIVDHICIQQCMLFQDCFSRMSYLQEWNMLHNIIVLLLLDIFKNVNKSYTLYDKGFRPIC